MIIRSVDPVIPFKTLEMYSTVILLLCTNKIIVEFIDWVKRFTYIYSMLIRC